MEERAEACLYVVGTPLGNREDLSPRAARTLGEVDLIACEDTRNSQRILQPLGISKPTVAYHEHNEQKQAIALADAIEQGKSIAIISDAGMPAISDPGFRIVRECRRRGLKVVPIPGPTAAMTALAASGLPSDGFLFLGFLPAKTAARKRSFEQYRDFAYTIIYYESTYRIEAFMDDLIEVLGPGRTVCIGRELTKMHETFYTGRADEVKQRLTSGSTKGEFVVMIAKEGYSLES
ncbi:MAG: 16S rRNA (cytidine(1402)-2'-O)-methyltransferase [Opitutales bacterium]|nr:16S rRNA (cytidine(1402)-2'-O)-methyltransferase [Opitutales bacterium]